MKLKTYIAENNTTQEELSKKLTAIKTGKTGMVRQTVSNAIADDCIVINSVIYAPRYKIENE